MGIKKYIVLSIVFLAIIGIYVYSIIPLESAYYELKFLGGRWELPIAVWLILPALLLFFASVLHMFFYGVKNFLTKRLTKKDYDTLVLEIKHTLLNEDKSFEYKTEPFKVLSAAIRKMRYNPKSADDKTGDTTLDEIFAILENIRDGKYVDLKKFRLRADNELLNQNRLNFDAADKKSVNEILKHCSNLESEACKKAYAALLNSASYADIKGYDFPMSGESLLTIFRRYADKKDKLTLTNDEIKALLEKADISSNEFLQIARELKNAIEPDPLLKLYDNIQSKNHHAAFAYLYLLFEFRLIDKAREFLENNSEDSEFEKFRILLFLRDNGKIVDTDLIIC